MDGSGNLHNFLFDLDGIQSPRFCRSVVVPRVIQILLKAALIYVMVGFWRKRSN